MPKLQIQVDLAIMRWLRTSDWVTRHRLYNKMKGMRSHFHICRRLKNIMSPDELLEGKATSMQMPDDMAIPLHDKSMKQLTLRDFWRNVPARRKSSERRMQQLPLHHFCAHGLK